MPAHTSQLLHFYALMEALAAFFTEGLCGQVLYLLPQVLQVCPAWWSGIVAGSVDGWYCMDSQ